MANAHKIPRNQVGAPGKGAAIVTRPAKSGNSASKPADLVTVEHGQRVTLQHHAADLAQRVADLEADRDKAHQDAISAAVERDALRARLAEIEAQEPVAFTLRFVGSPRINTDTTYRTQRLADEYADGCAECGGDARPIVTKLYARPVTAQAVPESVDGLVSVFSYDEVLTFTFRAESDADKFMARFEPTVDSAAPEHKA